MHSPITMTKGFLGSVAEALEWCEDYETALEVREEMWMTAGSATDLESAEAIIAMEWVAVDAGTSGTTSVRHRCSEGLLLTGG